LLVASLLSSPVIQLTVFYCSQEYLHRTLQYGFAKWLYNTNSGGNRNAGDVEENYHDKENEGKIAEMHKHLNLDTVERINNYMVMFSHAFANVNQLSGLFAVTAVSIGHMLRGAKGCLFLMDTKQRELFTISRNRYLASERAMRTKTSNTRRGNHNVNENEERKQ